MITDFNNFTEAAGVPPEKPKLRHLVNRQLLRNRFLQGDPGALQDYELFELQHFANKANKNEEEAPIKSGPLG